MDFKWWTWLRVVVPVQKLKGGSYIFISSHNAYGHGQRQHVQFYLNLGTPGYYVHDDEHTE